MVHATHQRPAYCIGRFLVLHNVTFGKRLYTSMSVLWQAYDYLHFGQKKYIV